MSERPTIGDLAREPARAATVPLDVVPDLLADVARVQALLLVRIMSGNGPHPAEEEPERMLDAEEAARMFSVSKRWLYRHATQMGAHHLSRKVVRFTASGIRRYLARIDRV